jgi:hypothetical protein
MKKFIISVAMVAFVAVFALALQQTGNLIVTVMSEEGQILPGASVTLTSNVLMGTRNLATGSNGKATFRSLPPGEYTIDVVMDGFQSYHQTGIDVRLSKTSKADVSMKLGQAKEVIDVVGTGPIVDTSSNTVSHDFDFNTYINHLPTGRHYVSVAGLSAGVTAGNNPSATGAGQYGNSYMLDGVSHMDPKTHTWSGQFNIDSVADVTVVNAGATAEYGLATGMIVNMVTKSGSNDVTALGRLEMTRVNWNDLSLLNPDSAADDRRQGADGDRKYYSIGGPLYPDVVWWFFGYYPSSTETIYNRYLDPFNPLVGTQAVRTYIGHFMNAKGTIQLGEDIKLSGFYREDPITINNISSQSYYGGYMQPSADELQTQGGKGYSASITYVASQDIFIEGLWSEGRNPLTFTYQDADPDGRWIASSHTGPFFQSADNWWWGSIVEDYSSERNHDSVKLAFNYLLQSDSMGDHDIKFGAEYLDNWTSVVDTYYPSGEFIKTSPVEGIGFDNVQWLYRYTYENRLPVKEVHNKTLTFYLQDSIQLSDALTINAGLRTDIADLLDNYDTSIYKDGIFSALAPRLGFAYDMGTVLVRGSVGRYYDIYSTYMIDDFTYFAIPETRTQYAPTDGVDGHNGWTQIDQWTVGSADINNTLDPDLGPAWMDEATLGMDYMFSDTLVLSLSGIYRNYCGLVSREDPDGDKYWYWTNINTPDHGSSYKIYYGGILELRKRPTEDNLFLDLSVTYQHLEGFAQDTLRYSYYSNPYQTDDRISYYWGDIGASQSNSGSYDGDMNWFAKAQATYFFPNNWYLGVIANWQQGNALTSYRSVNVPGYGNVTFYPNGRADMDRLPNQFLLNVQFGIEQTIEMPFDVPFWDDSILLGIYVNVNNLLDNQDEVQYQQNLASGSYGRSVAWLNARNYLLGFRIEL